MSRLFIFKIIIMFFVSDAFSEVKHDDMPTKIVQDFGVKPFSLENDICRVVVNDYHDSVLIMTVTQLGESFYLYVCRKKEGELNIKGKLEVSQNYIETIQRMISNTEVDLMKKLSNKQKDISFEVMGGGRLFFLEFMQGEKYNCTYWFLNTHLNINEQDSVSVKSVFKANNYYRGSLATSQ